MINVLQNQSSSLDKTNLNNSNLQTNHNDLVQQRTHEIKHLIYRTANNLIEIGHKLHEVKQILGHGKFGTWLHNEFHWSAATATKMMQAAQRFKNVDFTDLSFSPSAIYLLAAPSTPQEARTEALARAHQGQAITYSLAKQIVHQAKLPSSESEKNISGENLQKHSSQSKIENYNAEKLSITVSQPVLTFEPSSQLNPMVEIKFFEEYLVREWLRSKRENNVFSLILCTIENIAIMKNPVSQRHIETLSEIVVQEIGNILHRPTDVFTKHQPEQFIILLSNTSPGGVNKIAKTLHTNIMLQQRELFNSQKNLMPLVAAKLRIHSSIPHKDDDLKKIINLLTIQEPDF